MFKMIETKFSKRKFIESKNENFKDSENSIKRTKKASGFTMKRRNIMSEISINRFNSKSLRFVVKGTIILICNKSENKPEKHQRNRTQLWENCQLNFGYAEETYREQYHSREFF